MKTLLRLILFFSLIAGEAFGQPNTLQSKPTAASPAGDDWIYIAGATNSVRKLSPSYYVSTATAAATYQPLDAGLTSLASASTTGRFYYLASANTWAAVTVGSGLSFSGGTLTASGSGSVTSVATGTGLTGGPITSTGTISLANTAVSPGSYTSTNLTVDAQGRITAASNGTGGSGAPNDATYITQTPNGSLTNEQALSALATGILKSTTSTGVISIAAAGTDYQTPLTFGAGLTNTSGAITVNTTQNIATLSNLVSNGFVKTSGGTGALSIDTTTYLGKTGSFTAGNVVTTNGGGLAVDSGVVAIPSVTTSAGVGSAGLIPQLNGSGVLDLSFFQTVTAAKGGTANTTYTDGQLLIGNSSGNGLTKATLTAGSNITITNGNGSITIAASGSGGSGDIVSTLVAAENPITGTATALISRMNVCSGTSADYTVTLPTAVSNAGKLIGFRMAALGALSKEVTLATTGGQTIDGASSREMWALESCLLLSDGSNWFKIAGRSIPQICLMAPSTTTSAGNGAVVKIDVNTAIIDNTGRMADTTNKRVVFVRTGTYLISAYTRASNLGANCPRWISATLKSGATSPFFTQSECSGLSGGFVGVVAPVAQSMTKADYLELNMLQTSGSTQTVGGTGTTEDTNILAVEQVTW